MLCADCSVVHLLNLLSNFRYDPSSDRDVATRKQIPLVVCYGTTVHKAQGLTLDNVVVDCEGIFAPGQLAVAMGRARSAEQLQVTRFVKAKHIIPPKRDVMEFLNSSGEPFNDECCGNSKGSQMVDARNPPQCFDEPDEDIDESSDESDFTDDKEIISTLAELMNPVFDAIETDEDDKEASDTGSAREMSEDEGTADVGDIQQGDNDDDNPKTIPKLRISAIFNSANYFRSLLQNASIDEEKSKCLREFLSLSTTQELADSAAASLMSKYSECAKTSRGQTQFMSFFHSYSIKTYPPLISDIVGVVSQTGNRILMGMLKAIRLKVLAPKVNAKLDEEHQPSIPDITDACASKIRYLAGRCVVMCRKKCQQYLLKNGLKGRCRGKCAEQKLKLTHLNHMRTSLACLTNEKGSLDETERRQNLGRGLTHVTEEVHQFYLELERKRMTVHTPAAASEHTIHVLAEALKEILQSVKLFDLFTNIFISMEGCSDAIVKSLFDELVNGYMSVANNQFRKGLCEVLKKKKKYRHRVEIIRTSSKKKGQAMKGQATRSAKGKVSKSSEDAAKPTQSQATSGKKKGKATKGQAIKSSKGQVAASSEDLKESTQSQRSNKRKDSEQSSSLPIREKRTRKAKADKDFEYF